MLAAMFSSDCGASGFTAVSVMDKVRAAEVPHRHAAAVRNGQSNVQVTQDRLQFALVHAVLLRFRVLSRLAKLWCLEGDGL
jgi:hypothetical protein